MAIFAWLEGKAKIGRATGCLRRWKYFDRKLLRSFLILSIEAFDGRITCPNIGVKKPLPLVLLYLYIRGVKPDISRADG